MSAIRLGPIASFRPKADVSASDAARVATANASLFPMAASQHADQRVPRAVAVGRAPLVGPLAITDLLTVPERRQEQDVPADVVLRARLSAVRRQDHEHEFFGRRRA